MLWAVSIGAVGFLPVGDYKVNSPLTLTTSNRRAIKLIGDSPGQTTSQTGTTIKLGADLSAASTFLLTIDAGGQEARCIIEDISFDGGNFRGSGLQLKGFSNRVVVSRSMLQRFDEGTGLSVDLCIGVNLSGVHCEANATGLDIVANVQAGEGAVTGCKFASNTVNNVFVNTLTDFLSFLGCTFYEGRVQLADDIFSIGFHDCSFEQGWLYIASGHEVKELTVEGCVFSPQVTSGTRYCCDFLGEIQNSRIQHNLFSPAISTGATGGGLRCSATSINNTIGPNRMNLEGTGTKETYSPADVGEHFGTYRETGLQSTYGRVRLLRNDTTNVTQLGGVENSVANNGVLALLNYVAGLLVVRSGANVGLFQIGGGAVTEIADPSAAFSTASGTANSVNVYYHGGNTRYEVENKSGGTRSINVFLLGV